MIKVVVDNLRPSQPHRFIFLALAEAISAHKLESKLEAWAPNSICVPVSGITEGAACTVLLARDFIENEEPLMIANCDQYIEGSVDQYIDSMGDSDGLIMTMTAKDPKWSFVRRDASGRVVEVVEKKAVSDEATVGIYNFRTGRQFTMAADEMISENLRVNGEFYVAPTYNSMISKGSTVRTFNVGTVGSGMHGLGTPKDLEAFLESVASDTLRA